jgi:low affinity Fe/Cu permease
VSGIGRSPPRAGSGEDERTSARGLVLQHTQTRQQEALHHKLDEVLHALPGADDRVMRLETASDSELGGVELRHAALRDEAHGS